MESVLNLNIFKEDVRLLCDQQPAGTPQKSSTGMGATKASPRKIGGGFGGGSFARKPAPGFKPAPKFGATGAKVASASKDVPKIGRKFLEDIQEEFIINEDEDGIDEEEIKVTIMPRELKCSAVELPHEYAFKEKVAKLVKLKGGKGPGKEKVKKEKTQLGGANDAKANAKKSFADKKKDDKKNKTYAGK